ncbi:MAG: hypothetical protein IPM63_05730 [Acidobacteriota bacterium]|nr:MAG: hypothetical protein IPM63_05730 [Acidobacteriota bacterium]
MKWILAIFSLAFWFVPWSLSGCAKVMRPQPASALETPVKAESETNGTLSQDEEWTSGIVRECLKASQKTLRIESLRTVNPFYLRLNLDNTEVLDVAVLVKEPKKGIKGVLLCSDSKEPFLIGGGSTKANFLSTFPNVDFVTHRWDALDRENTQSISPSPRFKDLFRTKPPLAESIGFFFDGGAVFVYMSGDSYVVVEGG